MKKALGIGGKITRRLERQSLTPDINRKKAERGESRLWRLNAMEDAFCFYIGEFEDPEKEIFIEYDELIAAGAAYARQKPLSIKDVLNRLELEEPEFAGIVVAPELILKRKRMSRSSGLLLLHHKVNTNFFSDKTLDTINFFDFYEEVLQPKLQNAPNVINNTNRELLRELNHGETIIN